MRKRKNCYSKLYYIFISVLIITIIAIAFILYKTREDKQNRSLDYYSNFEELKENTTEGKDWRIKTKNRKDKKLAKSITKSLKNKGFTVQKSPKGIEATSSSNIINRSDNDSGVQLELTTGQRALFFKDKQLDQNTRKNPDNYTHTFYKFAKAVNKGIEDAQ